MSISMLFHLEGKAQYHKCSTCDSKVLLKQFDFFVWMDHNAVQILQHLNLICDY